MDTRTFLTRVSAAVDDVVICLWKPDPAGKAKDGIFWNVGSFSDYDDAVAAIQKWDHHQQWTVYYSIGRMAGNAETDSVTGKVTYRRTKDHSTWFKTLCFDLDIGDKYATQAEGHKAVMAASRAIGLPAPMVINSGRGIHYYWPLTAPIGRTQWEAASVGLRVALEDHGVQIDTSKIHDASMVLRPVGSHHKKQVPWREVSCMADCPDYDIASLEATLNKWIVAGQQGMGHALSNTVKPTSSVLTAILDNCNLNLEVLGKKCKQIGALLASGGEFDASGSPTSYPVWYGGMGIAKFTPDPEVSMVLLSEKHPDFDYDANIKKLNEWTKKPTTCAYFKQHCASGCQGCPYDGTVNSPAGLNEEVVAPPATPTAIAFAAAVNPAAPPVNPMPDGYYISNGAVWTDIETEKKGKDADGKPITTTVLVKTLVCPYEVHVLAMYHDMWGQKSSATTKSTATLSVTYPLDGVQEHELPLSYLVTGGKDFTGFLGDKQLFISSASTIEHTRKYLMNYLAKVQSLAPSGIDFTHFGWQKDGSFLCGETLVGSPSSNTLRRLKGAAREYSDAIHKNGDREVWAELTKLIDEPGAECLGVSLLAACIGVLGNVSGAATPIIAFVTDQSGTGKTLSLSFGNTAFMHPSDKFMFSPKDSQNALYKGLGVLGDLSGSIDELTTLEPTELVKLAYDVSLGREKKTLTIDRNSRTPEEWRAPVRVTSNRSLFELYEIVQSKDEPLRMRTIEFALDTREFVNVHGTYLMTMLQDHYGHALPELAEGVIAMGGRRELWRKGNEAFERKFQSAGFLAEERFRRNTVAACYIVAELGKRIGLFRFDTDRILKFMVQRCVEMRHNAKTLTNDAFDIVGQFMQEHNHQMITTRKDPGSSEKVQQPVPDLACMRMELILDAKGAVQPGSVLYINNATFKAWLRRTRDSLPRVVAELSAMGGVLTENHRVTIYKGTGMNPGQAMCLGVDLTHQRMSTTINNRPTAVPVTSPAAAVLAHGSGASVIAAMSNQP